MVFSLSPTSVKLKWILITVQLTIETLAWRRALFSSCNCLQRSLQVSSSIFKTLFSCFRRAMRFFSLWATDDELSSALISLSLNPVPSIEELNELAILETHSSHKALQEVISRRGKQAVARNSYRKSVFREHSFQIRNHCPSRKNPVVKIQRQIFQMNSPRTIAFSLAWISSDYFGSLLFPQ